MNVASDPLPLESTNDNDGAARASIGVLICDDHRVLGDALAMLIGTDPGLKLLAAPFDRADAAVDAAVHLKPDVVLMDVVLPGGTSGLEATRAIMAASPRTKVVVMSGSLDPAGSLVDAIEAGAAGFMSKTEAATSLLASIRSAGRGESLLPPGLLARAMQRVSATRSAREAVVQRTAGLTDREREILQLVSQGESSKDIAADLVLSVHTINTHVRNILSKLEVHSKLQAVALAAKAGAITVHR